MSNQNGSIRQWIVARAEPSGQFSARVLGLPELCALATTRDEAIDQVRAMLNDWFASGQLVPIDVPGPNPLLAFPGHLDPNDPLETEFVEELARQRREDIEQTLQEDACPSSSSTPTT